MNKFVIISILLLFSTRIFCQDVQLGSPKSNLTVPKSIRPEVTIGNLNNYVRPNVILTTVDQMKQQKIINVTEGYSLVGSTVYFSGAGFFNIHVTNIAGMTYFLDSCRSGTVITFDEIKVQNNKTGQIVDADMPCYIFDIKDAHIPTKDQSEFHWLANTFYFKGDIYFSGTNFPYVYIIHVPASQASQYQEIFKKVKAGSSVSFENVVYRNEDGSLSKPFSKTIKVDDALIDDSVIY